ncbi:MAG: hypothetical protein Q9205_001985 [Flavoplaca limonia]
MVALVCPPGDQVPAPAIEVDSRCEAQLQADRDETKRIQTFELRAFGQALIGRGVLATSPTSSTRTTQRSKQRRVKNRVKWDDENVFLKPDRFRERAEPSGAPTSSVGTRL